MAVFQNYFYTMRFEKLTYSQPFRVYLPSERRIEDVLFPNILDRLHLAKNKYIGRSMYVNFRFNIRCSIWVKTALR